MLIICGGGGGIRASLRFEKKTEFFEKSSKTIDIFRTEVNPLGLPTNDHTYLWLCSEWDRD